MSIKIFLDESEIPRQWYNIAAGSPRGKPPLAPDGSQLIPEMLAPVLYEYYRAGTEH